MIVTLTTDFGLRDGYVAAMKGAMVCAAPAVRLVDVTHEVPAQDVMTAAFALRQVVGHFPPDTVHLAVVDPGVGTDRRAIAARFTAAGAPQRFVGPDNGLLALVAGPEAVTEVVELTTAPDASATFHGRDVFGPAAARLAVGADLAALGPPVDELASLHWPLARTDDQGVFGMVLHVDQFGNCVTNISREDFDRHADGRTFKCYVGSGVFRSHGRTYAEVGAGDPLTLFGSSGMLEVAVNRGHASRLLSVHRGDTVHLVFDAPRAEPAPHRLASSAR
ncbi:SAM hydrolase/SAM-dependent halogenase family protein [Rubrivirga sp.]|uniref:SAM hydrolase/SAM-dependent halogenase family protein n=1 Tax=Rubrivirga sp. TaxID=1885344 RepID=UPI003B52546C